MSKYKTEESRVHLARELAQESIVLLQNDDNCLPLMKGSSVAVFGRTQNDTVIGGSGSGASFSKNILEISSELVKAGLEPDHSLSEFYKAVKEKELVESQKKNEEMASFFESLAGLVASGAIYEIFGKYNAPKEEPIPDDSIIAKCTSDTAILIIGRVSGGEECDRHIQDDYYLTDSEKKLVQIVTEHFKKIIVVYNVNGACDTSWMKQYSNIKAAIFMGSCGEQGAGALADIITGTVTPSAKLSQTLAMAYEDYPSAEYFTCDKEGEIKTYDTYGLSAEKNGSNGYTISPVTLYHEGIYVGYRYFDTFKKSVMYPFGHGLSYAKFQLDEEKIRKENGKIVINVKVVNQSDRFAGKEVVQLYVQIPSGRLEQPLHQLKAVAKTKLLSCGESEEVELSFHIADIASFDENACSYILEPGVYRICVGNSIENLRCTAALKVEKEIIVRKVSADIGVKAVNKDKISFLSARENDENNEFVDGEANIPTMLTISEEDLTESWPKYKAYDFSVSAKSSELQDVVDGTVTMEEFINQMSTEELAVLCNGYGPGLPFAGAGQAAPSTIQDKNGNDIAYGSHKTAMPGYMSPAISKYGIESICYKDGPASVGNVAWPTGMMLSCSFNEKILYEFGAAIGYEATCQNIDSWLAPGMNIIRNPIEGRAFEYFSEDPYLAGYCGVAICKGAQDNNVISVCPKHFALNEQETYRRGSTKKSIDAVDSIVEARAAREIYLRPFEKVITEVHPNTIMTSFNKINGEFAAGNSVLCTEILRKEWGYDGVVVTDWGDMDAVVDGADAVAAGNDVIMPGGPPVINQVLAGYQEGRVTLEQMKTAVAHLLNFVIHSVSFKQNKKLS